ncbi:inner membrane protein [Actinobacillus pleuropneumoniae]|nr:inner membrane protein [Actinobacillus pleuropneumoniae]
MAFSSLFTLLDDIASVLDDVSVMTKVAAKRPPVSSVTT